uniref:Type 1 glutamine amidotransferase-like domain-containing protein n=1 Tax=Oceanobacillus massiliensis TaxID=1465765 RepID=UPI0030196A00
ANIASAKTGPIAVLFIEREGWRDYMPTYTKLVKDFGPDDYEYLPLPSTPIEKVVQSISSCSGIIVGGGVTNLYADFIVETAIADAIKERFHSGIPYAGFSAGALISPANCVISPKDNETKSFQSRKGLGLVSDLVIAVHFSQWKDEGHLRNAANKLPGCTYYGIDERNGIYLKNGKLQDKEGEGIYQLEVPIGVPVTSRFLLKFVERPVQ